MCVCNSRLLEFQPHALVIQLSAVSHDYSTNHHSLQDSLFRKNLIDNPYCSCESSPETLDHFLWDCSLYSAQREWLINKLNKANFNTPRCSVNLLKSPNSAFTKILLEYIIYKCKKNI